MKAKKNKDNKQPRMTTLGYGSIKPFRDGGYWIWILENNLVMGERSEMPDFSPQGHWEYVASLEEQVCEAQEAIGAAIIAMGAKR